MLFLSYLFATAGYQKFYSGNHFQKSISEYRVIPASWSRGLARLLPVVELAAGIGLLVPSLQMVAALAVCALLVLYTVAIAINVVRGRRDLDCGCSGSDQEQVVSGVLLARNATLFALALVLVFNPIS